MVHGRTVCPNPNFIETVDLVDIEMLLITKGGLHAMDDLFSRLVQI